MKKLLTLGIVAVMAVGAYFVASVDNMEQEGAAANDIVLLLIK